VAFLGSFSAFVLCVIGPIAAKVALERRCGVFDACVVALAVVMGVWGTGAAFLDA
jgi:vesicular inhibitory amino acid transporter